MSQQPNPAASAMGMLTPADILRIVRKRLLLILACFVLLGGGGTAGVIVWYFMAPSYTAEGVIEVEPGQAQSPIVGSMENQIPVALFEQYVLSQVLAVRNARVLNAALETLDKPESDGQTMFIGPARAYYLGLRLAVGHTPSTQNIFVSLRGRDKEQVNRIVKAVLEQYVDLRKVEQTQVDADRQKDLRNERDDLRKQLDDLQRKLASFRDDYAVIITDERGGSEQLTLLNVLVRQLAEVRAAVTEANTAWVQFQDLRKQAEEGKDLTPILMAFPEVMEALRKDPSISAMTDQASRMAQELQSLTQRFGQKHDSVTRMKAALQGAQNDLQNKQSEVLGQLFQQQAALLKSRYGRTSAAEADLLTRVAEARAQALQSSKQLAEYRGREADFLTVQALYKTVTDGLERMRISSALARPNIRVVGWPDAMEISEPRPILYIPATLVFGLIVGLGLSLLVELMDTRLRTPHEIVRHVGVPFLGSIPDLTEDERLALDTNVALVSQAMPQSLLAEAFRQFRTNLMFSSDHPVRSLLITSPSPEDGKTMIAVNTAITMARSGARVLLIEANFRKPCVARILDLPETIGLSNVLVGLNTVAETIQATRIENLDVLVTGPLPPSPAELLGSAAMRQLVRDMVQRYDNIIIDGAPMLVVTDNYILAEAVDGVVMVFRAGENTRGLALRAARQVQSLRARLLGGVLNRVRATKGGYFRESFQAYYDYAGAASLVEPTTLQPKPAAASSVVALEDPPDGSAPKA